MSPSGTRFRKKEKENSFSSHSTEGAAVPLLREARHQHPFAGTSCLLKSLILALPTDKDCAAPEKQIAVAISELKKGESHVGSVLEKKKQ